MMTSVSIKSCVISVQLRTNERSLASRTALPARQVRPQRLAVVAEESMTDAYARIRESRKRAAAERVS